MKRGFLRGAIGLTAATTMAGVISAGTAAAAPTAPAAARPAGFAARAREFSLARLHLVTGIVTDPAGRGLAGVCVTAVAPGQPATFARTSAGGRYALAVRGPGTYTVRYRECQIGGAAATPRSAASTPQVRQIQVGASPVTTAPETMLGRPASGFAAALAAAGVVAPRPGRLVMLSPPGAPRSALTRGPKPPVIAAGLAGKVTSPAGKPLADICVWVVGNGFAVGMQTSRNGTYRISADGIPVGSYPIEFTSPCFNTNSNPFLAIAPGRWAPEFYQDKFSFSAANKVRLTARRVARGIDAVMQPGGEVAGVVTGSDGRRIKDACAVLTTKAGVEAGQAVTNSRGQYTITGLDPGRYRLIAVPCGGDSADYAETWYPDVPAIAKARPVVVRLGHLTGGIDVVMQKLGTITGQIRLGGKSGKPLGGICVGSNLTTNILVGGFATSRPNGTYVMTGLPAGRYDVEANVGGCGNNGNYAPAYLARPVRVTDGSTTTGVNLYLQPGGILSGTVTDAATGLPLGGICVSDDNGDGAVTSSNGTYAIEQLPAEQTTVQFGGGCGNTGSYAPQYYDGQSVAEAAETVTVTTGGTTSGIDAAMLPGATISGRVTGSSGRAVANVCVTPVPAPYLGTPVGFLGGEASTSSSGSYSVANLGPGQYAVVFFGGCQPLGSYAAAQQWFDGQPTYATAGLVSVQPGQAVSGVNAVITRSGSIAGTITTAAGQPAQFACVTAISASTGLAGGDEVLSFGGQYTIAGLAPGRYTVGAVSCGGQNLAGSTHRGYVTVRAGRTTGGVDFALGRGGTITGRVTVRASGKPASDICVSANPVSLVPAELGYGGTAVTSRSGTYRIAGLNTGRYQMQINDCSGSGETLAELTLPRTVQVTQGRVTAGVNASLPPGATITGQVTGPGGAAVPGACVELYQVPGDYLVDATTTDAHGSYSLTGEAAGRYQVEFADPSCSDGAVGLAAQWYDGSAGAGSAAVISVRAGQTVTGVSASLAADGSITGTVTGPGSTPLTGVCVSAVPVSAAFSTVYAVSAGGSYSLTDLQPGQYRVEFQPGCGAIGLATQWWDDAASSRAAALVTVTAGSTVTGISAHMASG